MESKQNQKIKAQLPDLFSTCNKVIMELQKDCRGYENDLKQRMVQEEESFVALCLKEANLK